MRRAKPVSWVVALALLLACAPALAACGVTAANISFGPYDPLSAAGSTVAGSVTVNCDDSPPPNVTIAIGPSATSGGFFPRRMMQSGGSDRLDYNLYVDPGGASVWGTGAGGTTTVTSRVQKNKPWVATIYGRVGGNQDVSIGNYSDSLEITINF